MLGSGKGLVLKAFIWDGHACETHKIFSHDDTWIPTGNFSDVDAAQSEKGNSTPHQ